MHRAMERFTRRVPSRQRAGLPAGRRSSATSSFGGSEAIVQRAYDRVPLFRKRMDERRSGPATSSRLDDIARLPFTVKTDLRDTYPFGLFASPMEEIVRLHASSGTTGKPIVVAYTQEDIDVWTQRHGAQLRRVRPAPRRHHPERLRLRPVHRRPGRPLRRARRWAPRSSRSPAATPTARSWCMKDFGVTAICCTPQLLPAPDRARGRTGRRYQETAAAGRRLRRRALDARRCGARIEAETQHQGLRHLRPVRDHRPRRGHRVRRAGRAAHLRGPLLPRDHRSRDAASPCPTAQRANWC